MTERLFAALRALVYGPPKPNWPTAPVAPSDYAEPIICPEINPLDSDEGERALQEAALSLMDPGTVGFLLVKVDRSPVGPTAEATIQQHVSDELWPAVEATLARIVLAAYDVR